MAPGSFASGSLLSGLGWSTVLARRWQPPVVVEPLQLVMAGSRARPLSLPSKIPATLAIRSLAGGDNSTRLLGPPENLRKACRKVGQVAAQNTRCVAVSLAAAVDYAVCAGCLCAQSTAAYPPADHNTCKLHNRLALARALQGFGRRCLTSASLRKRPSPRLVVDWRSRWAAGPAWRRAARCRGQGLGLGEALDWRAAPAQLASRQGQQMGLGIGGQQMAGRSAHGAGDGQVFQVFVAGFDGHGRGPGAACAALR